MCFEWMAKLRYIFHVNCECFIRIEYQISVVAFRIAEDVVAFRVLFWLCCVCFSQLRVLLSSLVVERNSFRLSRPHCVTSTTNSRTVFWCGINLHINRIRQPPHLSYSSEIGSCNQGLSGGTDKVKNITKKFTQDGPLKHSNKGCPCAWKREWNQKKGLWVVCPKWN